MGFSLVARPLVRLLLTQVAPEIFACRVCESTIEADILVVLDHYWSEHPVAVTAGLTGTVGLVVLAAATATPRRRR